MPQHVLITGASGGIGLELARVFAARGYNLVLIARNTQRLQQIERELTNSHSIDVRIIPKDLTAAQAAGDIYAQIQEQQITIDILINNAGFGMQGPASESDLTRQLDMLRLNITALVQLTHLFSKEMRERGSGIILNVASTAAFMPGPYMAAYYASKAFVLSYSEALSAELKGHGVQISTLCPGPTKTEFAATAKVERSRIFDSGLLHIMDARRVALITYKQLMRGKRCITPGVLNKLSVQSVRIMPRFLSLQVVKWLHQNA